MKLETKKKLLAEQERLTAQLESEKDTDVRNELLEELDRIERTLNQSGRGMKIAEICVKVGLGIFGTVAPLLAYNMWQKRGYEFEKSGMIMTSAQFREVKGITKPRGQL